MSDGKTTKTTASESNPSPSRGTSARKHPAGPGSTAKATVSREAQQLAVVILEVLAGVRTPTQAAAVLGFAVPRYYLWEQRAIEGLARACEPRPKGQVMSQRHQIAVLEKEVTHLRQECGRQQALVRAAQRTMSLAASAHTSAKPAAKPSGKATAKAAIATAGKGKRKRRPAVRALKAVAVLQAAPSGDHDHEYMVPDMVPEIPAESSLAAGTEVVQRSAMSNSAATVDADQATSLVAAAVPEA
jgi:hypothetical protein